jgi:hypothetical protein
VPDVIAVLYCAKSMTTIKLIKTNTNMEHSIHLPGSTVKCLIFTKTWWLRANLQLTKKCAFPRTLHCHLPPKQATAIRKVQSILTPLASPAK